MMLAIAIVAWSLLAWGGRIGLLGSGEGLGAWVRIGGSLMVGLLAAAALTIDGLAPARRGLLTVFAVWSVLLWGRALVINWAGDGSLGFKMVHTVLAIGFFALAWLAFLQASPAAGVTGESATAPTATADE